MDSLVFNNVTYWLPESVGDVITLVNDAKASNAVICLRGSAHSFPVIETLEEGPTGGRPYKYVMLSKMNTVTITGKTVKVDAGCHLGVDPWDPNKEPATVSSKENSLLYKLNEQGLAIQDLGGISHQTVGGFLATASSGGSTKYSFEEALMSIDIVTCEEGGAVLRTFTRPSPDNPDDPFYAAGIGSRGLFGVIVSATFNCVDRYFIAGQEAVTYVSPADGHPACEIDLFPNTTGSTGPSLQQFLQPPSSSDPNPKAHLRPDYTRLIWWPQENVHKMVVWKAWQATEEEAFEWAYPEGSKIPETPKDHIPPLNHPLKPYQEVPWVGGSPTTMNLGASFLYSAIGEWPKWLYDLLGNDNKDNHYNEIVGAVDLLFYPVILPKILDIFAPVDKNGPQLFSDEWHTGLPMDNQMSDKLMPVWFTELWIPIERAQDVMNTLRDYYDQSPKNTGAFTCEIYAAKRNSFWMSPSYNTDVIRIDIFWFGKNSGNPVAFYEGFWNLLAPFNFRPHWGKYLPEPAIPGQPSSQGGPGRNLEQWTNYLQSRYPKWDSWEKLRQLYDPNNVFLNDYWRKHLFGVEPLIKNQ